MTSHKLIQQITTTQITTGEHKLTVAIINNTVLFLFVKYVTEILSHQFVSLRIQVNAYLYNKTQLGVFYISLAGHNYILSKGTMLKQGI